MNKPNLLLKMVNYISIMILKMMFKLKFVKNERENRSNDLKLFASFNLGFNQCFNPCLVLIFIHLTFMNTHKMSQFDVQVWLLFLLVSNLWKAFVIPTLVLWLRQKLEMLALKTTKELDRSTPQWIDVHNPLAANEKKKFNLKNNFNFNSFKRRECTHQFIMCLEADDIFQIIMNFIRSGFHKGHLSIVFFNLFEH